jgi:hypothetical protein
LCGAGLPELLGKLTGFALALLHAKRVAQFVTYRYVENLVQGNPEFAQKFSAVFGIDGEECLV